MGFVIDRSTSGHMKGRGAPDSVHNVSHTLDALRSPSVQERDDAWRAMYDEHFAWVYRLVFRFGVPQSDVEDVTQQIFLVAYRRMLEVERIDNVPGWLRGVVVRVVSGHHRWRKVRRVKKWLVDSTMRAGARPPESPQQRVEVAETQKLVGAVLAEMSPKLRAVLVLADIEECPVREVATALDIPVNTVRSRRRLAREAFQKKWCEAMGEGQP